MIPPLDADLAIYLQSSIGPAGFLGALASEGVLSLAASLGQGRSRVPDAVWMRLKKPGVLEFVPFSSLW